MSGPRLARHRGATRGPRRMREAVRLAVLRMTPAARRDWVEAIWAEAAEVPSGWRRLAWLAGGMRLVAREVLMRRKVGIAILFAAAAALAAATAWSGSPAYLAASHERAEVLAMVAVLGCLPLLTRWLFGPVSDSRAGRALRVSAYAAILATIPAWHVLGLVRDTRPRAGLDLRLYFLIEHGDQGLGVLLVIVMTLYAAIILWLTSQRSRITPAALRAGCRAGIMAGVVVYAVAPLGLSKQATNPWLPGSDIDPLVLLAGGLSLLAPAWAAAAAWRDTAIVSPSRPHRSRARQGISAALLTSLVSALLVTALGMGTTALMVREGWLRQWLYHGSHQLYGIMGLGALVHGNPQAIAYSHELTASSDASVFLVICIAFPLIALALTGLSALDLGEPAVHRPERPPPGGGGWPGPQLGPPPPGGGQLAGPSREKDRLLVG
jgi:hypothetical protein